MQIGAAALAASLTILVVGCTSSSPRFRAGDGSPEIAGAEDDEIRFASKIREEEMREDDRKVDENEITRVTSRSQPSARYKNLVPKGLNRDHLLLSVVSYLGVPYVFGGTDKNGIDCSGFTSMIYGTAAGKQLPRSTTDQYNAGRDVAQTDLQFGDLVFFNTTGRRPSHVGIYIEDDLFAHVSVSRGVTISSLESTYYRRRFVGARRLFD